MSVVLENTTAGQVSVAISAERFAQGSSTVGRVLTLVILTDESAQADAVHAAVRAAREHPCRILAVIPRPGRGHPQLDARVTVGGADGLGEVVELRLRGPLAGHAQSVVLPLLVPDAPVVAWWPSKAPDVPSEDPVGRLAQRRITDAAAHTRPLAALAVRKDGYRAGDTDLAWTRLTNWRALLAAAFDLPYDPIRSVSVHVQRSNPSGPLLAAWLRQALDVPVEVVPSRGPAVTAVRITTKHGEISINRPDGRVAKIVRPGMPDRQAALLRRSLEQLIAEELRRLDPDEIYAEALHHLTDADLTTARRVRSAGSNGRKSAAKRATGTARAAGSARSTRTRT